jgi:hypothetical protein
MGRVKLLKNLENEITLVITDRKNVTKLRPDGDDARP